MKERKAKNSRELLGLESVGLMIKKSRLRWFDNGTFEHEDDNDWVKHCMMWEVEGIRQRGCPKQTWWDYLKDDMDSCPKRMHSFKVSREGELRGSWLTRVHLEKWLLKQRMCTR